MVIALPNERQTPLTPCGAANSPLPHCLGSVLKSKIKNEHRTHVWRKNNLIPPWGQASCRPKRKHHFLLTAEHEQGISPVLMTKRIILWRKKLAQFNLLSFLPHMAQVTHFAHGPCSCSQALCDIPEVHLVWEDTGKLLSPEHLRHWMMGSTEDTKTLKCISF